MQQLRPEATGTQERGTKKISETGFWSDEHGQYRDDKLASAVASFFGPGTAVADLGCGPGHYVRAMRAVGVVAFGWDGNPLTPSLGGKYCEVADLTDELHLGLFDWVLSLEVGEHIPEKYADRYLDNLHRHNTRGIVLSWAIPGQGGRGHVNCRPNEWVREYFHGRGYVSDPAVEAQLREAAGMGWFKNTIMVFRKSQSPSQS